MANSIARYLFNEAASGTSPTHVIDDTGNGNDLTIDYSSGDAVWSEDSEGRFLDFTAAPVVSAPSAIAKLDNILANGNIGSSYNNTTQLWFQTVAEIDAAHSNGCRIFQLGTDTGNGRIALVDNGTYCSVRINTATVANIGTLVGRGKVHLIVSIDTSQVDANERVRIYVDGIRQTPTGTPPAQDTSIDVNYTTFSLSVGNRGSGDRNIDGKIRYLEFFTDAPTIQEISDCYSALSANDDADWATPNQPPVANDNSYSLPDDSANGFVIGNFVATDSDGTIVGYSITGTRLAIDNSGQITLADNTNLASLSEITETVTATDDGGATDMAAITVNVTSAQLSIDSVSAGPHYPLDNVTFNVSNANTSGKTVAIPAGQLATSETSNTVTATNPDPKNFGDNSTPYDENISYTVGDGSSSASNDGSISIPLGDYHGTITDTAGYDSNGLSGRVVGDKAYAKWIQGSGSVDLATGSFSSTGGGVLRIWFQPSSTGIWGNSTDLVVYADNSFSKTLIRNPNRNNRLISKFKNGDAPPWVVAGDPVVLFSDITSAPRQGWSSSDVNRGAVVTLFGFNFGSFVQDSTYVTVGGVDITSASDFPATWGQAAQNPRLETITFHLNYNIPLGNNDVTITTGGKTSIPISMNVTNRNIYFANPSASGGNGSLENPWQDVVNFTSSAVAGDVLYLRGGSYTNLIDGGNAIFYIRGDSPTVENRANNGTATDHISISGYPGETATLSAPGAIQGGGAWRGISIKSSYWTFANITVRCTGAGIDLGSSSDGMECRAINCDVSGAQASGDQAGHIITQGSGHSVLACRAHGGRSNDHLDHAMYLSGDAGDKGCHIGYNYIYDNDFDYGALVVINHQSDRIPNNKKCRSHYIYCNFIDAENYPTVGISAYSQSWDSGSDTAGEPDPSYIFNNVLYRCGRDRNIPALAVWSAHTRWTNNTLFECNGAGVIIANARVISCELKNNIFHMIDGNVHEYVRKIDLEAGAVVTLGSNCYFNHTGSRIYDNYTDDTNVVSTDPELVIDKLEATIVQGNWTKTAGTSVTNEKDFSAIDRAEIYGLGAVA